jgi:SAM-dependent methyltransferase
MDLVIGDALGEAMLAYLAGSSGEHVLERDDGWFDIMDTAVYFNEPDDWPVGESAVLEHVHGRVLDIGAGAGRYALALQQLGHDVVALDVSPGAVDVCRRRGVREVMVGTIYDVSPRQRFDTFLLGGHNLGLLESPTLAPRFLDRLQILANGGARIVGTSRDPGTLTGPAHIEYKARNLAAGRAAGEFRFRVRWDRTSTDWFKYWLIGSDEFEALSNQRGWRSTHVELLEFGSYLAVSESV